MEVFLEDKRIMLWIFKALYMKKHKVGSTTNTQKRKSLSARLYKKEEKTDEEMVEGTATTI
eukprot:8288785-Ditylum_brightwellii.AAC.1